MGGTSFYKGELAKEMAAGLQENGGLLTYDDFRQHRSDWVHPISVQYGDMMSIICPPNTQGFASLSILNILNQFDLQSMEEGSADYYHLIVEAIKPGLFDRNHCYLTDPEFSPILVGQLLL